ncbi:hypothetical protein LSH36_309g00017 [Paralvinella palmiformis]|uniref:Uncharacterized protein n=1 Tax=Paralvinella palmiformis TaxID=53620 RepID=A0AAD9JI06_9ANNE|nr:hypothetical protein LSH36_309g00017 [Paralvinella palmiformis]
MDTSEILNSPAVAICILAIFYILAGDTLTLIDYMGFATWLFLAFVQLSVIILRFKMKDAPRTYKVPLPFPILLFVFGLTLVIIPLVNSPQIQFLYAALAIFGGLVLYLLIVVLRKTPKCMGYLTVFFQLMLDVCPTTTIAKDEDKSA